MKETVPAYIINKNVYENLKPLIKDMKRIGCWPVVIIDNDSTYPPLLDFYKTLTDILVIDNGICTSRDSFRVVDSEHLCQPYVLTDSDLDLSSVPDDVIEVLKKGLRKYPWSIKVGLSLEINNIPDYYPYKNKVIEWESRFWKNRLDSSFWKADIATTFALYRGIGVIPTKFENSIRVDRPYTAKHRPWYIDPDNMTEEYKYLLSKPIVGEQGWTSRHQLLKKGK